MCTLITAQVEVQSRKCKKGMGSSEPKDKCRDYVTFLIKRFVSTPTAGSCKDTSCEY